MYMATSSAPRPCVGLRVQGGLGNQLFQLATADAQAHRQGAELLLVNVYVLLGGCTPRHTYWHDELRAFRPWLVSEEEWTRLPRQITKEPRFAWDPLPPPSPSHVQHLVGYFQSPRYFQARRDAFRALVQWPAHRARFLEAVHAHGARAVALHFRVGDFARYPRVHPVLPLSYYVAALRTLPADPPWTVWAVCDPASVHDTDPLWTQLPALFPASWTWHRVSSALPEWDQLGWMSACDAHVLSNSTFAWWAAYWNEEGVPVRYPSPWFGPDGPSDTSDLCPSEWTPVPWTPVP
jgi:hypothetical protein